ncbi:MAG: PAS domain S-box protein [Desulfatirhabdiaceae bacterium]|nr:PAS domain S-box protein [Desulfatirhabdiaceae bacterium]
MPPEIPETSSQKHPIEQPSSGTRGAESAEHGVEFDDAKYRQIFESFEDLYYEVDLAENIRVLSPSVFAITGWRPEELIGRPVRSIYVNPEDRDPLLEIYFTKGSVQNYILSLKKKDGSQTSASINARVLYDADGNATGVSGTIRDVSESLKTRAALQESEEKFRTLAESSPFAIMIYQNDRWIYTNPEGERICGFSSEELYNLNFWDFVHPDDLAVVQSRGKARQGGQNAQKSYEFRIIAKDGIEKWVVLTGASITYQGQPAGLISVFDITDRKRAEQEKAKLQEQLRQSQKLESVGLLAGGVAHDLNNLLQPMMGFSELLLADSSQSETARRHIQQIIRTGERARELVQQLMAFGRRQILEIRPLKLNRVITDFSKLLRRTLREDIQVRLELSPEIRDIRADSSQVEQILMNLAVNAQDAMPGGGTLAIETENASLDEHFASLHSGVVPGDYVRLSVSDTGIGMEADTAARIFEPFFTTKELGKGTGLGLATVYGIVKQHGGNIWVYSEPGRGTTFKMYLPVSDVADKVEAAQITGSESTGGSETILVAEDDEMVRELTCEILEALGYRVMSAETAGKCLELAQDNAAAIDLLLTDVVMPEMSGKELFMRIAEIRPGLRALFMSGYPADIIAQRGVLDADVNFIQKPFSLESLSQKIRQILGG